MRESASGTYIVCGGSGYQCMFLNDGCTKANYQPVKLKPAIAKFVQNIDLRCKVSRRYARFFLEMP